jgi:hypothetical protein
MEQLQIYLYEETKSFLKDMKRKMTRAKRALKKLKSLDVNQGEYIVRLDSMWKDEGEKSITRTHIGCLEEAIRRGEEQFKQENQRSDVQARYDVRISIGGIKYSIPEKYWQKYTSKR